MDDISVPDGVAKRLRGYGYKPNGTQIDTDAIARKIVRLPGVSNDPVTLEGIRYILELEFGNADSTDNANRSEGTPRGNGHRGMERKEGKGKRRKVTDVLPSI